jgi:hypothetical protein
MGNYRRIPAMPNHNKSDDTAALIGAGLAALLAVTIAAGSAVGWVRNVIVVTRSDFHNIDGELVVRVVGIPMAPVGAVMGWIP